MNVPLRRGVARRLGLRLPRGTQADWVIDPGYVWAVRGRRGGAVVVDPSLPAGFMVGGLDHGITKGMVARLVSRQAVDAFNARLLQQDALRAEESPPRHTLAEWRAEREALWYRSGPEDASD